MIFRRSFRKSVAHKPDVRKQLDDFEDHRPYFTYWITTVQILILIISLACYGFGPIGMGLTQKSGLVRMLKYSIFCGNIIQKKKKIYTTLRIFEAKTFSTLAFIQIFAPFNKCEIRLLTIFHLIKRPFFI